MSYIVTSVRETGTITYHCRSTRCALEKMQEFRRADYSDITVTADDEQAISERQLISLIALEMMLAHQ
ncbi:hypothetical protein R1A27_34695 (plasmid) [Methylobacterium sp. NMS12]|uniref:hypothetical protein n=1 Tax=Methylobacterium sp. NMS12 TaxID=3079766 RepID=UPI003F883E58